MPAGTVWREWGPFGRALDTMEAMKTAIVEEVSKKLRSFCDWPMVFHCSLVVSICWMAGSHGWSLGVVFVPAILYLWEIAKRQRIEMIHRIRHEERKTAAQRKPMADSETVRWLNGVLERVWPAFLENILSKVVIPALSPWFFDKYKPRQVKQVFLQQLFLGSAPPHIASARILTTHGYDDHVVLEMAGEFVASQDMYAVIVGQPYRLYSLGLKGACRVSKVIIEGKVLVGMKFLPEWPFISRIRFCFAGAPYVSLAVRPINNFGIDFAELPGIAGWLDKMLVTALESSMVEPNMLVVDVQKLVEHYMPSSSSGASPLPQQTTLDPADFFHVKEMESCAEVLIEIIEARNLKAADANGFSDPFVKGALGSARFKTRMKRKTLSPQWFEEFRAPISTWNKQNFLILRVRDKDTFKCDELGYCVFDLNKYRGGQRFEFWQDLKNVKRGKLHLAVTIFENENRTKVNTTPVMPSPPEAVFETVKHETQSIQKSDDIFDRDVVDEGILDSGKGIPNENDKFFFKTSKKPPLGTSQKIPSPSIDTKKKEFAPNMEASNFRGFDQVLAGKRMDYKDINLENSLKEGERHHKQGEEVLKLISKVSLAAWADKVDQSECEPNLRDKNDFENNNCSKYPSLVMPRTPSKSAPVSPKSTSPLSSPTRVFAKTPPPSSTSWGKRRGFSQGDIEGALSAGVSPIHSSRTSLTSSPKARSCSSWENGKTSASPSPSSSLPPSPSGIASSFPSNPFASVDDDIDLDVSRRGRKDLQMEKDEKVKDEIEQISIGLGPSGFLTTVRPGEEVTKVKWKGRTGGRKSEAAAREGFMEGEGRKSMLDLAMESLEDGDFDAEGVTCTWKGEEHCDKVLEDFNNLEEGTPRKGWKKWFKSLKKHESPNKKGGNLSVEMTLEKEKVEKALQEGNFKDQKERISVYEATEEVLGTFHDLKSVSRDKTKKVLKSIDVVTHVFKK